MGFGKKTDPGSGKLLDLDQTYKHIIKPCVEKCGYKCVRSDEIMDSSFIDRSMYVLLMKSDLVIADISTYNPNAIYELGVRHAVKPFSTIILQEESEKIPFDINHNRLFKYSHLGSDIGADEVERCSRELTALIDTVTITPVTDSPMYEFLHVLNQPTISEDEYQTIIKELAGNEKNLFAITELANEMRKTSNFIEAAKQWKKASELVEKEPFFIQQYALCTYKSKNPSELSSLNDAFTIISQLLDDGNTNDPETLGIAGAICKRLWLLTGDTTYLERSISFYEKGFTINNDYYTGENYAECLDMFSKLQTKNDEKNYYIIRAKKIREGIIKTLESIIPRDLTDNDFKWQYASMAICNLRLGNIDEFKKFRSHFLGCNPEGWEVDTFNQTVERS